jgi:hypothetical protein
MANKQSGHEDACRVLWAQVIIAVALVVHDMAEQFVSRKEGISRVGFMSSCAHPSLALMDSDMVEQVVLKRESINGVILVSRGANPSQPIVYF